MSPMAFSASSLAVMVSERAFPAFLADASDCCAAVCASVLARSAALAESAAFVALHSAALLLRAAAAAEPAEAEALSAAFSSEPFAFAAASTAVCPHFSTAATNCSYTLGVIVSVVLLVSMVS